MAPNPPLLLSPALPSELLSYVVTHHVYPTTLIIGCPREDFMAALTQDLVAAAQRSGPQGRPAARAHHHLLAAPLYQVAVARHIRVLFVPTVTHLRALLSVFSPDDSQVPAPPAGRPRQQPGGEGGGGDGEGRAAPPLLLVYGFLGIHRDTSEWSAQGLGATAAGLVEAAKRSGFRAVVVDPPSGGGALGAGAEGEGDARAGLDAALAEEVPVLSGSARRLALAADEGGWTGRTVGVGRVMGRWFRFEERDWNRGRTGEERR